MNKCPLHDKSTIRTDRAWNSRKYLFTNEKLFVKNCAKIWNYFRINYHFLSKKVNFAKWSLQNKDV